MNTEGPSAPEEFRNLDDRHRGTLRCPFSMAMRKLLSFLRTNHEYRGPRGPDTLDRTGEAKIRSLLQGSFGQRKLDASGTVKMGGPRCREARGSRHNGIEVPDLAFVSRENVDVSHENSRNGAHKSRCSTRTMEVGVYVSHVSRMGSGPR